LTGKFASAYAGYIAEMNEFEGVRKDPSIKSLLAKGQTAARLFNSTALKTPCKPTLIKKKE
jgi:hypothetical protein